MFELRSAWLASLAVILMLAACASSTTPDGVMGNTNWLAVCADDDDCEAEGLSCECGVCTRECTLASDCAGLDRAVCDAGSDALSAVCGVGHELNLCLSECAGDRECGAGFECLDARCIPKALASSDGGPDAETADLCGATAAFVTHNIIPDQECIFLTEGGAFLPQGLFDIANGGSGSNCDQPYKLALLVHSCLQGDDDVLQLHSAEVTLKTIDGSLIVFDRLDPPLPNPFLVTTNNSIFPREDVAPTRAIAAIEAIPRAYARQLDGLVGAKILAEVEIFGTTIGDRDIEVRPFVYTIELCEGCLQVCESALEPGFAPEDVYGNECPDNASADGRVCIDPDC